MEAPERAPIVAGTGGLRKLRFAPPSWRSGKSGATRVCYFYFIAGEAVYLLTAFGKNEKTNLSAAERNEIRKLIASIQAQLQRGSKP